MTPAAFDRVNCPVGRLEMRAIEGLSGIGVRTDTADAGIVPEAFRPNMQICDDGNLALETGSITIFHPARTSMAVSDPITVIDDHLRICGVDRVRLFDTSIMPTISSGNGISRTVMSAERGLEMIHADLRA